MLAACEGLSILGINEINFSQLFHVTEVRLLLIKFVLSEENNAY